MKGTSPKGTAGEREASAYVRQMFAEVAPKYDLLNHLLSFHIDKLWRARTVKRLESILLRPDSVVLDVCCGTGDLALALRRSSQGAVLGSDFCHPMLQAARSKSPGSSTWFESDALALPVRDRSLDAVTVAFGFRNLANSENGLRELRRVLRPGGIAAILEFSTPPNPAFAAFYNFYSRRILPVIGGAISGSRDAYTYLPESVRKFPDAPTLAVWMQNAGFKSVAFERMTFGIVALHLATA
ncbi:MAG TPA: bifunctional demethylmenaquinone methyltransferase/2-methoxy-6-polyprenyl-1,4-benzoquinol methylase UbiE [Bryobacteraceae bacterium]|nr:bifunctional demethylmenaquinone methyltransferase/2-methoxy-6-polyprenyl-1,4-benzoquinol methylase UbiE [Bryobacteraceae bacterium]